MAEFSLRNCKVGVIGLGYVGLPLAVEFGKHFRTVGFDIKASRVAELKKGKDSTLEVEPAELRAAELLSYSTNLKDLRPCQVYIVTVPTPIDDYKRPDLRPIEGASELIGQVLKKGDVVVFESTVYPGCTEEVAVPILERLSGLKFNVEGHTDNVGNAAANNELSLRRATAVRDYLISQGVAASTIDVAGFGSSRPEADNSTAEGRARNRRVEIVVSGGPLATGSGAVAAR